MKAQAKRWTGFTIVELLVVIAIIGILSAVTIVSYVGVSKRAVAVALKSDLSNAAKTLKLFYVDNNTHPITIDCGQPDSSTNKCLKPGQGSQFDGYSRQTPQTFVLRAKQSDSIYIVTESSQPTEAAPLSSIGLATGTIQVGSTITAGALSPDGATASYKWQVSTTANGTYADISGATARTYTPTSGDTGKYLRVIATGTGTFWSSVTSAASGPVAPAPPILASGGTITTSGGYRTHTFGVGTYNLTTNYGGTIEVVISGAGGGGGSLDSSNARSYTGNNSSIITGGKTYIAYGGQGGMSTTGFTCLGSGGNGSGGTTNTAGLGTLSGVTGGGSAGGFAGYFWDTNPSCMAGAGGAGGKISGTISVPIGQAITVSVGTGGTSLPSSDYDGGPGAAGLVTIRYQG